MILSGKTVEYVTMQSYCTVLFIDQLRKEMKLQIWSTNRNGLIKVQPIVDKNAFITGNMQIYGSAKYMDLNISIDGMFHTYLVGNSVCLSGVLCMYA